MTFFRLSLKALAITFAAMVFAGGVLSLARPRPIESAVLGAEWQCSLTAFVLTTCSPRIQEATPAARATGKIVQRDPRA